jgi:hypothetical protein
VIIVALSFTTLSAKLLIGNNFSLDYVVFFVYLLVLPTYIYHHKNNINFYKNTVFLSVGLIIASLMAYIFKNSGNLRDYIVLLDYVKEDIIRFSGFFGDPNYYSAQILVAITSLLVLILIGEKNHKPILGLLAVMLVGLGFLSASKMFLVILFIISILWLAAIFIIKGRFALRISILGLLGMVAMLVFVFGVFDESIRIYEARFENSNSVSEITTGRSDIAKNYIDYHINNRGYLILGQGLTNKYLPELDDRAAHNTIIQTIYQLGVIGCLLLLAWTIRLFHLFRIDKLKPSPLTVIVALMLGVGYFGSWLFLDMLYLDDYFFTIIVLATSFKFLNEKQKSTRNINRAGT